MLSHLSKYRIILASNSPRRRELLAGLGIEFEVRVLPDIDESFPSGLPLREIAGYVSAKKAAAYMKDMTADELLITADTVVLAGDEVMGKPVDEADACRMLHKLSGNTHQVVTGVSIVTLQKESHFSVTTDVTFRQLDDDEIAYYIEHYKPMDKAGAYGIQEWIGYVGCTGLKGSYYNVMGLPVQRIYSELKSF